MPSSRPSKPARRPAAQQQRPYAVRKRPLTFAVLAGVLILVLVFGAMAALFSSGNSTADNQRNPIPEEGTVLPLPEGHPALALARRDAEDPLAMGDADAPVVMIEYSDFQSAFSGTHARGVHHELIAEYVDAGALRIEFRNFPVYGPESDAASRAAWAAGQQGRFWEFYDAAFADEFHRDTGRFSEEGLRELAQAAGVPDVEQMLTDMESPEADEAVATDAEEGVELGATTTPAFLVNGHPIVGAQSMDTFRDTIDQLLDAA
ncbi:DsbA family protein [Streptomyces sp. XC 2026]|uniref:DsbA family protein n=1 Tax=Streptomyces sp. XC 2026 TaxID=2782004 RepID=UPI001906CFAD|nr:DsbA family protein [Streptomyces sp. XC 2026]QQN77882.1 DsbA family protein [Streptomyces sp. XC 2026]